MSFQYPLSENVQGVLDGNGNATLRIGPANAYQTWQINSVSVNANVGSPNPSVSVYNSNNPSAQFLAGSYNGAQNSANIRAILQTGQKLCATFVGGKPGAIVTLSVGGTVQVP